MSNISKLNGCFYIIFRNVKQQTANSIKNIVHGGVSHATQQDQQPHAHNGTNYQNSTH